MNLGDSLTSLAPESAAPDEGRSAGRIAAALRRKIHPRWGTIGNSEREMGYRPGYLAKICQNIESAAIGSLFSILEHLGVKSQDFFHHALDLPPRPEMALDRLVDRLPRNSTNSHRRLRRLERRATFLVNQAKNTAPPPFAGNSATGWDSLMAQLAACPWPKDRRNLLWRPRFHHPAFLSFYLKHLEQRGDDPPYELSSTTFFLLMRVLPLLSADVERQRLVCRSLGLWGVCQVRIGRQRIGAIAIRRALHLARRGGHDLCCAEFLRHGATLLEEHGEDSEALAMLDEAQIFFMDLDLPSAVEQIARKRHKLAARLPKHAPHPQSPADDPW